MVLQRAVKVSLRWLGPKDRLLWREPGLGFTTQTSKRLVKTRLSGRYRDQALKQAWELVAATRKSAAALGVVAGRPFFRGAAVLDAKFVDVEQREGEHDLVVRLSSLKKGARLTVPTKGTRVLRKWLARPGARLVQGAGLGDGELLTPWVELPKPPLRLDGPVLGVDMGVRQLLATSDGMFLGSDFRDVRDKVKRRKPGSKGRRRARRERDDLIHDAVKRLPWGEISAVAVEDLSGIKRGKKRGQGKRLRRASRRSVRRGRRRRRSARSARPERSGEASSPRRSAGSVSLPARPHRRSKPRPERPGGRFRAPDQATRRAGERSLRRHGLHPSPP